MKEFPTIIIILYFSQESFLVEALILVQQIIAFLRRSKPNQKLLHRVALHWVLG